MIKFVYFDLGGVAISDFSGGTERWNTMKSIMGVKKEFDHAFDELYDQYEHDGLCLARDVDTLIPIFTKRFGMHFPPSFSILNYFVNHFEPNRYLWPVIEKVKKNSGVGLLTNMYVNMFDGIEKRGLLPPFDWDVIIDSTKVGLQKPDPKIFELAQKESGVNKNEILFIDNSKNNVDAAKKFGWQVFYYDSSDHEESCRKLMGFINESEEKK